MGPGPARCILSPPTVLDSFLQASVERGGGRSRWERSGGPVDGGEVGEEESFRAKRKAAGDLLKDLDSQLDALEQNIDRSKATRVQQGIF